MDKSEKVPFRENVTLGHQINSFQHWLQSFTLKLCPVSHVPLNRLGVQSPERLELLVCFHFFICRLFVHAHIKTTDDFKSHSRSPLNPFSTAGAKQPVNWSPRNWFFFTSLTLCDKIVPCFSTVLYKPGQFGDATVSWITGYLTGRPRYIRGDGWSDFPINTPI